MPRNRPTSRTPRPDGSGPRHGRSAIGLLAALLFLGPSAPASGQNPPPPTPAPPPPSAPKPETSSDEILKELRALRESNRELAEQLKRATREHDERIKRLNEQVEKLSGRVDAADANGAESKPAPAEPATTGPAPSRDDAIDFGDETPVPDYQDGVFPSPDSRAASAAASKSDVNSLRGKFGPGFQFRTEDDRFRLQFHYESQIEGRVWGRPDAFAGNDGVFLPRQRIFFNGNITKPIEYEISINRGLNNINLLNAYINIHLRDEFEFRAGRFFAPFGYDQFAISNYWMPTPERSVFISNLGLNRQIGLMAWGYLADKRLDYAFGVFNGSRNSFENLDGTMDFAAFLNVRPFQNSEWDFARFLNLGTSIAVGRQDQAPVPNSFRIAGGSPDANIPGVATVPFLILNRGVVEKGDRLLGAVHMAYFYKGLSLIGEWQYGNADYAVSALAPSANVPLSGFYVSGGYFLTGEHVERRARVKPLRPLLPTSKGDPVGPGAWEAVGRVSRLGLGDEIFTAGLADSKLWSNQATTTELGLNWYPNEYLKVYMFWLHGSFADPVEYRPGGLRSSADLFWMRFQLYF